MICLQTPSFGCSFQDGRQLASKQAHHKQRVARSSPNFQISGFFLFFSLDIFRPMPAWRLDVKRGSAVSCFKLMPCLVSYHIFIKLCKRGYIQHYVKYLKLYVYKNSRGSLGVSTLCSKIWFLHACRRAQVFINVSTDWLLGIRWTHLSITFIKLNYLFLAAE